MNDYSTCIPMSKLTLCTDIDITFFLYYTKTGYMVCLMASLCCDRYRLGLRVLLFLQLSFQLLLRRQLKDANT